MKSTSPACVPGRKLAKVLLPLAIVTTLAVWLLGQRPPHSAPGAAPQAAVAGKITQAPPGRAVSPSTAPATPPATGGPPSRKGVPLSQQQAFQALPSTERQSLWSSFHAARHLVRPLSAEETGLPQNQGVRFFAANPGQQLTARFLDGGVRIESGQGESWALTLRHGNGSTPPRAEEDRVEYAHGDGVTEWYVNRAKGLEHGFTLEGRPPGSQVGQPMTLTVAAEGLLPRALTAEEAGSGPRALQFVAAESGEPVVRYDGLKVEDATGRALPAWFEVDGAQVAIRVEDTGAVFPVTVDPLITSEQGKFAPNLQGLEGTAADNFGRAVALENGTALVGAPRDDTPAGVDAGSVYVFTGSNGVWSLQAKLMPTGGAQGDAFGVSVALSGDTAVAGAHLDDTESGVNVGSAYVFVRSGGVWTEQARLGASDGSTNDYFGHAVALSGDTALVGAYSHDTAGGVNAGSAYVYVRSGGAWTEQARLGASDGSVNDYLGVSVALSGDTALVGAYSDDTARGFDAGSAYVFVRSGGVWTEQARLESSDGSAQDLFGFSVALSGDTALVGAYSDDTAGGANTGSAYVFVRSGGGWTQQARLVASDALTNDYFGFSVALSGETALVGAVYHDLAGGVDVGSAYVYVRSGGVWAQQARLGASAGSAGDGFGISVALSGDTALVGAPYDDTVSGADAGSAHVFVRTGTNWSSPAQLKGDDVADSDLFGISVAVNGNTALVGAVWDDTAAGIDAGSVYVFVRAGSSWSEQAKLTAPEGNPHDNFGISVALDGNTAVVGAWQDDVDGDADAGSAYVFVRTSPVWTPQAKLTASDKAGGDKFGISVSLSGGIAVVGAYLDDVNGLVDAGSAYVFVRSGTGWSQEAKLTPSRMGTNHLFGRALSLQGNTLLAASLYETTEAGPNAGSAYVFVRNGTNWAQQARLTAADGEAGDTFGVAVALSGDLALVGSSYDTTTNGVWAGSAYVFGRSGTNWSPQAKLTAADGAAGDEFGRAVALEGNTAVVGSIFSDIPPGVTNAGSAYVYVRGTNGAWTQQAKLTVADGGSGDFFGNALALSTNTLIVGAFRADTSIGVDAGAAYVFVRDTNSAWLAQGKLETGNNADNDYFGVSVAVSGNLALVGAFQDDTAVGTDSGSVYVFGRDANGAWTQRSQLTPVDAAPYDQFGVALALDGITALISSRQDDTPAGVDAGSVYVFTQVSSQVWSQQAKLTASDGAAGDLFGQSVAFSTNVAVIGAFQADLPGATNAGSAYVFRRNGTNWVQEAKLNAPDAATGDEFGIAVALHGDTALVGSHYDTTPAGVWAGSVQVFVRNGTNWPRQAVLTAADGAPGDEFGRAVALNGDTALVGAVFDDLNSITNAGSAYVFVRSGSQWSQQAKLVAADPTEFGVFGTTVALRPDVAVVGSPRARTQETTNGAAYVFLREGTNWSQQAKLVASDGSSEDWFGHVVALSGDILLVGAVLDDTPAGVDSGSAYFFLLQQPAAITRQPVSLTNLAGTTAYLSVEATGIPPLTYAWFKDGYPLAGATNAILVLPNVQPVSIGGYRVVVSAPLGSVTSIVARLSIPQVDEDLWRGLIAYYPLDGTGDDLSAYGNHAVPQGAPGYGPDRNGQAGRAVLLNGTNQWLQAPHQNYLNSYPLTVSAWFKTSRELNGSAIVGKYYAASWNGWNLTFAADYGETNSRVYPWYLNGYVNGYIGEYGSPSFRTDRLSDGQWNHVVWMVDTNRSSMLVNGVLVAGADLRGTLYPSTTSQPLRIGLYVGPPTALSYFEGLIDEVRIYNRALTTNEAARLYASELSPLLVIQQPASQSVPVGGTAAFTVTATGAGPITYQWRRHGVAMTGATNPVLVLANVQTNQTGAYDVVVMNARSNVTSAVANLSVGAASDGSLLLVSPTNFWRFTEAGDQGTAWQAVGFDDLNWRVGIGLFYNETNPYPVPFNTLLTAPSAGGPITTYYRTRFTYPGDPSGAVLNITNYVDDGLICYLNGSEWFRLNMTSAPGVRFDTLAWASVVEPGVLVTNIPAPTLVSGENILAVEVHQHAPLSSDVVFGMSVAAAPGLAPLITQQPASRTNQVGSAAGFTVAAAGVAPLSYQWRRNGAGIPGATNATVVLSNVQPAQAGGYDVVVANAYGSVTSAVATLTVQKATPVISSLPTGSPIIYGQTLAASTLTGGSANVAGSFAYATPSLAPIVGTTNVTVVFTPADTNNYTSVTTNIALLVNKAPAVVTLGNLSHTYDGTAKCASAATTPAGLTVLLTYNASGTCPTAPGSYTVVGSVSDLNYAGQATNTLTITGVPPTLVQQPLSRTNAAGTLASFTVQATGPGTLSYQWRRNGIGLANGTGVAGANAATLSLTNVSGAWAGAYDVVVSNAYGSTNSQAALLTVLAPPSIARSPWQMHLGQGPVPFGSIAPYHGYEGEYAFSSMPVPQDAGWQLAPNPETIDFRTNSTLEPLSCRASGDFTYFQCFLDIPSNVVVTNFFLPITRVDDGVQLRIFNSSYPTGSLTSASYYFVGITNTADFAGLLRPGQLNRVVLSQVDDCVGDSYVYNAQLVLNGERVTIQPLTVFPAITSQPASRTNVAGTLADFRVAATAPAGTTYQWRRNGVPIADGPGVAGVTSTNLWLTNVLASSVGNYDVVVTSTYGSVTSAVATLSVLKATPVISVPPTGSPITYGQTLAASTLTAGSVNVLGTFAYATPSLAPNAGTTNVTVVFTPADTNNYTSVTTNIALLVNKAPAVVTLSGLSHTYDGTAKCASAATTPAGLAVLLTYNASGPCPTAPGSYTVVGSVSNLNYAGQATNTLTITGVPPALVQQPLSRTNAVGTLASFTVQATGPGTLSYQWRRNGIMLANGAGVAGATGATLSLTNVSGAWAGVYDVVVSNAYGSTNSQGALLTVLAPPSIARSPWQMHLGQGPVPFGTNTPYHGYEGEYAFSSMPVPQDAGWQSPPNPEAIDWETNSAIASLDLCRAYGDFTYFQCFLSLPSNIVVTNFHLPVTLVDDGMLLRVFNSSYPTGSLTSSSYYFLRGANPADFSALLRPGELNRVVLTHVDDCPGGAVLNNAQLVLNGERVTIQPLTVFPAITSQPASRTNLVGSLASFTVQATGPGTLYYQWRKEGANLAAGPGVAGVNGSTLWLTNVSMATAGGYSVVVSNAYGSVTSAVAALTVTGPPLITTQPQSLTNGVGSAATLSVGASGATPLSYQWRKNGLALPGATNAALAFTNLQPVHLGDYTVVVSNPYGSVTSAVAFLRLNSVNPVPWTGLMAWYPFNGNANDASGYGNHGVLNGALLDQDRLGQSGQACSLAGTNTSYVELPDNAAFKSSEYTVSLWFQALRWPSSTEGAAMLLSKGPNNFELQVGSPVNLPNGVSGLRFWPRLTSTGGSQSWDAPAGSYVTNDWNHLVATFSPGSNQVRLYLNGRQLTLTGPGTVSAGADLAGPARLGTPVGGAAGRSFQGRLDEVRIYNRALTAQEAQSIYQLESPDSDGDGLSDAYEQGFGRYEVVRGQLTWPQAKADAEARGGHLATITSAAEWEAIQAVLGPGAISSSGGGVVWLGASDTAVEGQWQWVTGERWQFTRWYPGEPSQQFGGPNEDYLITWWDLPADGAPSWNDQDVIPLSGFQGYLLEYGYYTDPRNPDTDSDGFGDGDELASGTSPVDAGSVPPNRFSQFVLVANTPGGGAVQPDPFLSSYPSNRLVKVTATPAAGWSFLGWQADAAGNVPVQTLTMSRSLCVKGIFGTPLTREVLGSGSVRVLPEASSYPYGTMVSLVAEPAAGYYFQRWTNAVNGPQNPRSYTVFSANPLLTAQFAPLATGHYALTLIPDGAGTVSATPQTNQYPAGTVVRLFAQPEIGQSFLGWSGDASGTQNPLNVTMDRSRSVTALFTRPITLEVLRCLGRVQTGPFRMTVTGGLGERYQVQGSLDMSAWSPLTLLTNTLGSAQWTDPGSGGTGRRYYRVLMQP